MAFCGLSDLLENRLVLLQVQHFPSVDCKLLLWRREVLLTISTKSKHGGVKWLAEGCLEGIDMARTGVLSPFH